MKYRNAADVFPDELLKEIQKYASGETIYIPSETKRQPWGQNSGARNFYEQRNAQIRAKYYQDHLKIKDLAAEYNLSEETIRKVLYK